MKRILIGFISMAAMVSLAAACTDLSGVEGRIDDLESRMAAMTNSVNELNNNVKALQAFSQSGQTVKGIVKNGNVYTITLGDGTIHNITIENGPIALNVAVDAEGYWTIDGKRVISPDGKPVRATGEKGDKGDKGDDGSAGANGADGKTPIFGVDSEGYWTIRYSETEQAQRITDENGAYVLAKGSSSTGSESPSGNCLFKSVAVVDGYLVIVLNSEPEQEYRLPLESAFRIVVKNDCTAILPGKTVEIPFEIVGEDATTHVFVEAQGYSATLKKNFVEVTAPASLPETGYVIIKAVRNSDSSTKAVCLTFEKGELTYVYDAKQVAAEGGIVSLSVTTNLDYEVVIPESVTWIHHSPVTKAITTSDVTLTVDANQGELRSATISIVPSMGETQNIQIVQVAAGEEVFESVNLQDVASFVLAGPAAGSQIALTQTVEDKDIFAFYSTLSPGELYVEMLGADGESLGAILPLSGSDIKAGEKQGFVQNKVGKGAWNIPAEGIYRVVLNRADNTIALYDEATDLKPLTVEFSYENLNPAAWILTKTLVAGKYYVNSMTGWDSWKGKAFDFTVSLADPQILVWTGNTFTIKDAICLKIAQSATEVDSITKGEATGTDPTADKQAGMNFISKSLGFVPATEPGVASSTDLDLKMNEWLPAAAVVSNRKWKPSANGASISKIVIDARNNRIRFE